MAAKRRAGKRKRALKELAVQAAPEPAAPAEPVPPPQIPHHMLIEGRLAYLLIALIFLLIFYPFLEGLLLGNEFLIFMATLVPIAAVYAVSYDKSHIGPAFTLAIPFITFNWLHAIVPIPPFFYINTFVQVVFYCYIVYVLLKHFLSAKDINTDMIFGAISVYLIIGIIFGAIFVALETTHPGSFNIGAKGVEGPLDWPDFIYYSLVTLTTTGYGDINPVSSIARSISVLESMTGVFYVAILVAQLMGVYVIKRARNLRKKHA